jgi:hypothetical protein
MIKLCKWSKDGAVGIRCENPKVKDTWGLSASHGGTYARTERSKGWFAARGKQYEVLKDPSDGNN